MVDEWSHAWNHVHGRGQWIPKWQDELATLLEEINHLRSNAAITRPKEYLFHQLELLNFLESPMGYQFPFFLRAWYNWADDFWGFTRHVINER